ncbi:hypothetical protein DM01DRAFT_1403473 [Hesseltinella vesiculosa]|uniref:Uncharacterized protein n=1 Tax=Hesseltinella vesiculosa TaxID=101127 RepID=A0A1X2GYD3_9FUNG|nr:hypothetical protein DM01DRAFT_1403473 [Hesseltinella vesiculosa]
MIEYIATASQYLAMITIAPVTILILMDIIVYAYRNISQLLHVHLVSSLPILYHFDSFHLSDNVAFLAHPQFHIITIRFP